MKNILRIFSLGCLLMTYLNTVEAKTSAIPVLSSDQIERSGFRESKTAARDLPSYRPLKRVLVTHAGEEQIKLLQTIAPNADIVSAQNSSKLKEMSGTFDAVFLSCGNPGVLQYAKGVSWVHSYSAGVEKCLSHPALLDEAQEKSLVVTNSRGTAAAIIAEHAVSMMMSFTRGLHRFRDSQLNSKWDRGLAGTGGATTTISGKTMLVLGLGAIGKEVARRANALEMRVVATRNSSRSGPDYVDYVGLADETLKLASEADVVVNTLPATKATEGLLNKDFFKVMKSSAILVSVGRGVTTNTEDLLTALQAGELAGAALDVTDPEPLPEDHPLWEQENVIITPHIAGSGGDARMRVFQLMLENARRYQAGEALLNQVSIQAGY